MSDDASPAGRATMTTAPVTLEWGVGGSVKFRYVGGRVARGTGSIVKSAGGGAGRGKEGRKMNGKTDERESQEGRNVRRREICLVLYVMWQNWRGWMGGR